MNRNCNSFVQLLSIELWSSFKQCCSCSCICINFWKSMLPVLLQLHLHKVLEKHVTAAVAVAVAVKRNSKSCRNFLSIPVTVTSVGLV